VDNEWTNQVVFGEHPTVAGGNRPGRAFMRAEATDVEDLYRNQQRALRIAELLFNLQDVDGIDARVDALRSGMLESTYAELECGAFLRRRGVTFRYVTPSGSKGADYDAEVHLPDGPKVNCEMKCKAEGTELGEGAVLNPLQAARKQLPAGEPGLVFLKVPESWVKRPEVAEVVPKIIDGFLRNTSRVKAVVVRWEEQHLQSHGSMTVYRYRLERGAQPKAVASPVEVLLTTLAGPAVADLVSFRAIAEEALLK
jgi:hypothetical protein